MHQDVDGDGVLDLVHEDVDGDGVMDVIHEDTDGDGVADLVRVCARVWGRGGETRVRCVRDAS